MRKAILLAALLAQAPFAGAAFKCVDETGRTRIGDTPPEQCANVVVYEISSSGKVLKQIAPTPSPDAIKQLREDAEKKKEADKQAALQKRKDDALLSTYANEREFDVARDRNIDPIRSRIRNSEERLKVIEAREKKIADEMEFYTAGKKKSSKKEADAPPPMLVEERDSLQKEKASIAAQKARQEKEIEDLKVRYETDKQRWIALKAGSSAPQAKNEQVRKTY